MEAAMTRCRQIGIPSSDNRDRELEQRRVLTLLDRGNDQVDEETSPGHFKIPIYMRVPGMEGISKQMAKKNIDLQLQRSLKHTSGYFAFPYRGR